MKKVIIICCTIGLMVSMVSGRKSISIKTIQTPDGESELESYIRSNYSNFSGCSFDSGTRTYYIGNNVYEIEGTMKDEGGWNHTIAGGIQLSPNGKQTDICYLSLDNKVSVNNPPSEEGSAPSGSTYPSESMSFSITCSGPMNILSDGTVENPLKVAVNESISYILTITNRGDLPINYLNFKIQKSSPHIIFKVDQGNKSAIVTSNGNSSVWEIDNNIEPGNSINETITLFADTSGTYNVKFYPYLGDSNNGFTFDGGSSDGEPYYEEADFVVSSSIKGEDSSEIAGNSTQASTEQSILSNSDNSDSQDDQFYQSPFYARALSTETKIKNCLKKDDKAGISELICYPIAVNINGKKEILKSASDFIKDYNAIFSESLKSAVLSTPSIEADTKELKNGYMLGNASNNVYIDDEHPEGVVDVLIWIINN